MEDIENENIIITLKNSTKIVEYCLINKAIKKYEEQTKYNMRQWSYCQLSWLFKYCNDVLEIKKMNNRYVCSKGQIRKQ